MTDTTRILHAIGEGDWHAAEDLLPLVYEELRKLAAIPRNPGHGFSKLSQANRKSTIGLAH